MKVVLMAGGRGTRISELFPNIPKPLIPISGIPVLEREIISLRNQGFKDIILTVGYMAEKIQQYFGNGNHLGVNISYFVEDKPLGNAGALFFLDLKEDFLLLNADALFDVNFNRMVKYHRERNSYVTLFTHPNSHPYDSGVIVSSADGIVEKWITKEEKRPLYYKNRVNAGLHIISPKVLELCNVNKEEIGMMIDGKIKKVDLDRQILKPLCNSGYMYSYDSPEYVKDMGTPERFYTVESDYKKGIVKARNLHNKQKASGTEEKRVKLKKMYKLVDEAESVLTDKNRSLDDFGKLLDITWKLKRETGGTVSTGSIDELYEKGITAGALGGKLLGAGGGGFLVFYVQPDKQNLVREAMKDLMYIPFKFENCGTRVIHYSPEEFELKGEI